MICVSGTKEPLVVMWIGNFYEPEHSSEIAMRKGLETIKAIGCNGFVLDSKGWEDFFEKYKSGTNSQYIKMQEYAIKVGKELGLGHMFLALYSCGDNLFQLGLRDSPVRYGEEVVNLNLDGKRTYKYWSAKAQSAMLEHCRGLLRTFGENHIVLENGRGNYKMPMITMFDPTVSPSFDEEGKIRYLNWLRERYQNIDVLNKRYNKDFKDFRNLTPEDYWMLDCPDESDFKEDSIRINKWVDNQLWRVEEMNAYFREMGKRFREDGLNLYKMPCLQQWKIFFNDANKCWWTTLRSIDPWKIRPYVDSVLFNTLPSDCDSRPDAYVVSCEASMGRSIQGNDNFIAGLYLGRYIAEDIYAHISPAEVIGSLVANGAKALHIYGYNGLDDGGVFSKMSSGFKDSVKAGIEWMKEVVPKITSPRRKEIAILFPRATAIIEPIGERTIFSGHRMDTLGWFKHLVDLGYMVDFLHPDQVNKGILKDYFALVLPIDSCYKYLPDKEMESKIVEFVNNGGILIHGANCQMLPSEFKIEEAPCKFECIRWREDIIPESIYFSFYRTGHAYACFDSGETAIAVHDYGKGKIYSFGFNVGFAYTKQRISPVPLKHGIQAMYPYILLNTTPVEDILNERRKPRFKNIKGVEIGDFGDRVIVVNHNPYEYSLDKFSSKRIYWQVDVDRVILMPHSAAMIIL